MDLASQGHPVVYMSLEMSIEAVMERMMVNYTNSPNYQLLRGGFKDLQPQWKKFSEWINRVPLMITEGHGKTWQDIETLIKQMNPKPRVIILDYVQCVTSTNFDRKGVIDDYIRSFRKHAMDNNYAAILCSQINRAGAAGTDNNEPGMHNLKETGCLEEIADKVILLHWPWFYNNAEDKNKYKLILAKNRNGSTGSVDIRYIPEYYKFEDSNNQPKVITPAVAQAVEMFHGTVVSEHTRSPK